MVRVDVYSDVVCPWCFIGTQRLERALDAAGAGAATVEHHPFLLHPEAPAEGIDLRAMLTRKYGAAPAHMFARVEAAARMEGLPIDFSRLSRTYSTVDAHTLLRASRGKGTQRELARALFAAYFLEARNVSSPEVLVDVATRWGFGEAEAAALVSDEAERSETHREADEARRAGINGVPFFVFNGAYAVSGAQPADVFRAALDRARGERPPDGADRS